MVTRPEDGAPSLVMVAAGGVGVLVVIAFVAAVAFGGRSVPARPGERLAVGRQATGADLAVFVPRCRDERVTAVAVGERGGSTLWQITSRKGSIDERYVVGADGAPLGFTTDVPLEGPLPEGELVATVTVEGDDEVTDRLTFTSGDVPTPARGARLEVVSEGGPVDIATFQARALSAAACPETRPNLGLTTIIFSAGALVVVGAYLVMVGRWWRGRGSA